MPPRLLFTLRLVLYEGEIYAEPFLLVGLILVVRRVLVVTAEGENLDRAGAHEPAARARRARRTCTSFGAAIFLLRRGAAAEHAPLAGKGESSAEPTAATTNPPQPRQRLATANLDPGPARADEDLGGERGQPMA